MATINVPEYDRQQYETAMQSIKNSTPTTTPTPAPAPVTTAPEPKPAPILNPTTPEQKSVLYGGESISNPDTLNTTVDTIRENVKNFSGVQQVEKELNADILKLYYPIFGDHIDYARAMGYDDSEIWEYLGGRETLARLQHPQHDINAYLQRTPEGMALAAAAERRRMIDAYVQASGLEREDVEDRMAVAEVLMLPPYILINDEKLYQELKPQYKLREGYIESFINGMRANEVSRKQAQLWSELMYQWGVDPSSELLKQDEVLEKEAQQYAMPLIKKPLQSGVGGTGQMLGLMANSTTRGLSYAIPAAGMALWVGQAGPQIALPEELITAPGAAAAGMAAGAFMEMFEREGGWPFVSS